MSTHPPAKQSFGQQVSTLAKRGLLYLIVAVVAIIALKIVVGVAIGLLMSVLTIIVVLAVVAGLGYLFLKL